jgi:WD40 repeat protein
LCAAGALLVRDLDFDAEVDTRLWSPAALAIFRNRTCGVLMGHLDAVVSAVFSFDGRRIVTASSDKSARIWDAATGNEITTLQGHANSVRIDSIAVFSPDGQRIVTEFGDSVRIWDAATGQEIAALQGDTNSIRNQPVPRSDQGQRRWRSADRECRSPGQWRRRRQRRTR